ncbi:hypothetical protein [Actinocrispum wychmicini]|uniref:4-hydroxy-3-methylbut-2-enyl diphosphate reductase n=1 Tax=Actinocrispum wychmicini TaxID=1213861 RepID=A0A4R2ISU8_9PSEU|nr:hypothetical protein [Actinocrispum wychmicini]TCO45885.1 4-hydroxy-3-methylbut-2-enyl diphosphate reductase [Actinocrispum wychmicini]
MMRTRVEEILPVGVRPPAGQVVVATALRHPRRGRVTCPAALLLGSALQRRGIRVCYEEWSAAAVSGTARVVSYLTAEGAAVGLAAAAPWGDDGLAAVVAAEMRRWSRVWRSRIVVSAQARPSCSGVLAARRAVAAVLADGPGPVYTLGVVPGVSDPASRVEVVDSVDLVPDGARVVVAQAGAGLAVRAEAAARGLAVTEATCPFVAAAAGEVRRLAEQGETVVLVSDPAHAAVPGLVGQAPEQVRVMPPDGAAEDVVVDDPRRVGVVRAPGAALADTRPAAEALRDRFGQVIPQRPGTLCHEPSDRQAALSRLAAETDVVLLAVRPSGHHTAGQDVDLGMVLDVIRAAGTPVHVVTQLGDIRPDWLRRAAAVGVTGCVTAPDGLVEQITRMLTGLGPVELVEVTSRSSPVTWLGEATTPGELLNA